MKPIAQTFIAVEPATGVEAVFLTGLDLYFQASDSALGVEIQIRETSNGYPTQNILPFASKILPASSVVISPDSSLATNFTFDTPVILQSNVQYAIVVVPVGGNPNYTIWTANLGDTDAVSGAPIFTNNQLGSLFISSNDLNFTPVQNESMKYNLYTAQFTASSGYAVYRNANTDYFLIKDSLGTFTPGEQVVVANNNLQLASLTISGSNTFTGGEVVNQTVGSGIYANGVVYFSNTTQVLLSNVQGAFATTNTITGATSGKIAASPSAVYQNVVTTSACNVITVPDANTSMTTDFTVGDYIYVGTNTRSYVQVVKITIADAANKRLTVTPAITFADSSAIIGRVKSDAALTGIFSSKSVLGTKSLLILDNVTSNASINFSGSGNNLLIGLSSGASANNIGLSDLTYDSITSQFTYISPKLTTQDWNFKGISKTKTADSSYTSLTPDSPFEFIDQQRLIMSRSNEFANPIGGVAGASSLLIKTDVVTSNNEVSPYIDRIRNITTLTHNKISPSSSLTGYFLTLSNTSGQINVGDTIWMSNSIANTYGTVTYSNTTFIAISSIASSNSLNIGQFSANGTSFITDTNNSNTANVTAVTAFSEDLGNGIFGTRYISKNVVLDQGQDAEDIITYLGAYRPPGTNFQVYAKCIAAADGDAFNNKPWTQMVETSSPALLSSLVNRNDYVELSYDLPQSTQVYASGGTGGSTTTTVSVPSTGSTSAFQPGGFIYITDATPANANGFNVRQIISVPNSTAVVVASNLTFTSGNCAIGTIPINTQTSVFRYSSNYNIARYSTPADSVYDTIKTFAIKIVLVSNTSQVVPRVTDMRTIAMQA